MNKSLIILSLFLVISCTGPRLVRKISLKEQSISFTKVKLIINSNSYNDITLKGYIYILKDSSICFKFFGPLSIDVMRGIVNKEFKLYDNYNKQLYSDVFYLIKQRSGIDINLSVLQSLLFSDLDLCKSSLDKLNANNLLIDSINSKPNEILISSSLNGDLFSIKFFKKQLLPSKLEIEYKGLNQRYKIVLEFIAISNERRICNFNFND